MIIHENNMEKLMTDKLNEKVEPTEPNEQKEVIELICTMQPTDSAEPQIVKVKRKVYILIAISFVTIILMAYIGITLYFTYHYLPNTIINGHDGSYMTWQELDKILNEEVEAYELQIFGRFNIEETITGKEIDLKYISNNKLSQIIENQNSFLWFTSFFKTQEHSLTHNYEYNEEKTKEAVENLAFFSKKNVKLPVNAYIAPYDEITGSYSIVPEDNGAKLNENQTLAVVNKAITLLENKIDLDEQNCYDKPEILQDNESLINRLANCNQYVSTEITYEFGNEQVVLDGDTISQWIQIYPRGMLLIENNMKEYVKHLANTYDTYGKNRNFTTTDGRIKNLKSGAYGWKINVKEETKILQSLVKNGEITTREPVYSMKAAAREPDDIGSTYIEIDLGKQHLFFYQDGILQLETDFVSGNVATGDTTPAGVFGITYRSRNVTLRGPTWETFVNYWMPFNGGIGLHDAKWRKIFGGEIYLTNGSHGCINLPFTIARTLYDNIYAGLPVICYY